MVVVALFEQVVAESEGLEVLEYLMLVVLLLP